MTPDDALAATAVRPEPRPLGFLRPKGNLEPAQLAVLLVVAAVPLLMVAVRSAALPGVVGPGFDIGIIRSIGQTLNESLSLTAVPPAQRNRVFYLVLLPLSALVIAFARLTLGIRVLGFRSILISIGFRQSGIVPSLVLIGLVSATIIAVRPRMRSIRLPRYARISVIFSIVVIIMLGALIVAPLLRAPAVWNLAFFPVIVLGLLAEGIARSMERDSPAAASWRAATTIVLAFLIAFVCWSSGVRAVMLQFPELVVTQVVGIILVSEYLDLRLLQDWDSRLAGMALPRLFTREGAYRVAVVRNRENTGVIGRLGRTAPKRYARRSIQKLVDALRDGGHTVRVVEGDMGLLRELREFLPPHPRTGQPGGLVLNLAHGIQGGSRHAHVPAMLELAGVAYTGPTPAGHVAATDQVISKKLLADVGVPTPAYVEMSDPADDPGDLAFPVVVKPRHEPSYPLVIAENAKQLRAEVKRALRRYAQPVVVEERVDGEQIWIGVVGNDPPRCLPAVGLDPGTGSKVCPAPLAAEVVDRLRDHAVAAFSACGCRDFARMEFRVGPGGDVRFLEVSSIGILERNGAFATAARQAGHSWEDLVGRIVEIARARYLSGESVRKAPARTTGDAPDVADTAA